MICKEKEIRSPPKEEVKEVEKCKIPEGKEDIQIHIQHRNYTVSSILKLFTMYNNRHSEKSIEQKWVMQWFGKRTMLTMT